MAEVGESFVHLRVRSAYSLLEGAIKVGDIATLAAKNGMPAVALTDRANLFGALEFSQACASKGVQPIIGATLGVSRPPAIGGSGGIDSLVLLAQDETGYGNLCKLVSAAHLDRPLDLQTVALHD